MRQWRCSILTGHLESDKTATLLEQHGVVNGQHVAVFATNTPEMVLAIVALTKLGAVPALINAALRGECTKLPKTEAKMWRLSRTNYVEPYVVGPLT